MATSLQTTNYGFGKYAPDDVTSYLTDYNSTMDKIDSAIKGVSDVANEAKATGDSNLNNIAGLSRGLTATNKNVENLGKTQTAQQTEIDDLKNDVAAISIGELKSVAFNASTQGTEIYVNARNVGGSAIGSCNFYMAEKTLTNFIAIESNQNLFAIGQIAGNVFNLKNKVVSRGFCVCGSGEHVQTTFNALLAVGLFYNNETNLTYYGFISAESSLAFPGGVAMGIFV